MPRINSTPGQLSFPSQVNPAAPAASPSQPLTFPSTVPAANAQDQFQAGALGSAATSFSMGEPQEPQYEMYTVKRGDTLGEISKKFLGSTQNFNQIFEANRDQLMNPGDLRIGMTLKIPVPVERQVNFPNQPAQPAQPAQTTVTPPTNNAATAQPAEPAAPASEPAFTEYTVKRGESLSIVALRTLDDSERYMEIFEANRDQLKTPNALQPGMVLKIPNGHAPVDDSDNAQGTAAADAAAAVDASGLTPGATELLGAMQRYQQHHAALGNTQRTRTTPDQMREIAVELDAAGREFGVDPKMMLALFAHESGGINPRAKSHTGAGGLGQLTGIAIRQVHHMSGIAKGFKGEAPYNGNKSNFVQSTRSIEQRFDIKANVWTSTAYMSYELNDRAHLGRGVEKALKRYGDPNVSTYANKVNDEYKTLFGGSLF